MSKNKLDKVNKLILEYKGVLIVGAVALTYTMFFLPRYYGIATPFGGGSGIGLSMNKEMSIAEQNYYADSYAPLSNTSSLAVPVDEYRYTGAPDRVYSTNTYISMLVKNVRDTVTEIRQTVENTGGYVVSMNINTPNEKEYAQLTVKVPTTELNTVLENLRNLSVKVVNESNGTDDITVSYSDNKKRLEILEENRDRVAELMKQATDVNDILNIQNQLFVLEDQITYTKSQQESLEEEASKTTLTIELSTDEFALSYIPDNEWRPELVFKYAVRSITTNLRSLINVMIWVGVYAAVIAPVIIISGFLYKNLSKNSK